MATESLSAPTEARSLILRIPGCAATGRREFRSTVESVEAAVAAYERLRDESGEGASTFADGDVTGPSGERYRISYNGRVWSVPTGVRP